MKTNNSLKFIKRNIQTNNPKLKESAYKTYIHPLDGIQDIKFSQVIRLGQRIKNETLLETSGKPLDRS